MKKFSLDTYNTSFSFWYVHIAILTGGILFLCAAIFMNAQEFNTWLRIILVLGGVFILLYQVKELLTYLKRDKIVFYLTYFEIHANQQIYTFDYSKISYFGLQEEPTHLAWALEEQAEATTYDPVYKEFIKSNVCIERDKKFLETIFLFFTITFKSAPSNLPNLNGRIHTKSNVEDVWTNENRADVYYSLFNVENNKKQNLIEFLQNVTKQRVIILPPLKLKIK